MINFPDSLPDDINVLKKLIADQWVRNDPLEADKQTALHKNQQLLTENQQYKTQVLTLQEQLNLALARRYAASSEKRSPDQICLFDEAEVAIDTAEEDTEDVITVPAHTRKKKGRKSLPDTLPRVDVIHDLPDSERTCPHDGNTLQAMSEVISEQLDIIPAKIQVIRHIRKQYNMLVAVVNVSS